MMNENMRRIQISQENKIEELMQPMKNSLLTLIEAQRDQALQREELQEIKKKHEVLQQKCHQIEQENQDLRTRVTKLEIRMLEGNLIMRGLKEDPWELEDNLKERIHKAISATVDDDHYSERIQVARNIGIRTTKRLGKYRKDKSRPVVVCFERKQLADILLENRSYLPKGIFVDREYTKEVENNRRLLKPILRLVKLIPKYQGKCKLNEDTLIIPGTKYTVNTIHLLPPDLSGFRASSRTSKETLGFLWNLTHYQISICVGLQLKTRNIIPVNNSFSIRKLFILVIVQQQREFLHQIVLLNVNSWERKSMAITMRAGLRQQKSLFFQE